MSALRNTARCFCSGNALPSGWTRFRSHTHRAPIIKRYCKVATSGRVHIPVDPNAPIAAFEAIATGYPVFRIVTQGLS